MHEKLMNFNQIKDATTCAETFDLMFQNQKSKLQD